MENTLRLLNNSKKTTQEYTHYYNNEHIQNTLKRTTP
ncbi:IS3 family transposase [Aggregatibacter actinomycetemcomitans]